MIESISGFWSAVLFVWKHRGTIASVGGLQKLEEEKEQLRGRIKELESEAESAQGRNEARVGGLTAEIQTLREQLDVQGTFEDGVYWMHGARGSRVPICPVCYGADAKKIPMRYENRYRYCSRCDATIEDPGRPPQRDLPPDLFDDRDSMTGY